MASIVNSGLIHELAIHFGMHEWKKYFSIERSENYKLDKMYFCIRETLSAGEREGFVTDKISYIILRGRWCNIIVLKVHTRTY
jgi:hypothetical protein